MSKLFGIAITFVVLAFGGVSVFGQGAAGDNPAAGAATAKDATAAPSDNAAGTADQGADGATYPGSAVMAIQEPGLMEALVFYLLAAAVIASALGVVVSQNIVRMAMWLLGTLGGVAALYFLMAATFLGAIQLIVYAGGTLVLIIFGVMLTSKSPWIRFTPKRTEVAVAVIACGALLVSLGAVIMRTDWSAPRGAVAGWTVADLGQSLLTTYLVPFELASVLLLVVMIGAAYMARQEKR